MALDEILKTIQIKTGMTNKVIADRAGINRTTLWRLQKNGITSRTRKDMLCGLSHLFNEIDPKIYEEFLLGLEVLGPKDSDANATVNVPEYISFGESEDTVCGNSWSEEGAKYSEKIAALTSVYIEKLPKLLYDDLSCRMFAEFFSWVSDDYDAIWYLVKSPASTTYEALSYCYSDKMSALELAQEQERLDYALLQLKKLGFTKELLEDNALFENGQIPATIFELGNGGEDYQRALLKKIYCNRLFSKVDLKDFASENSLPSDIDSRLECLLRCVMQEIYVDGSYSLDMSEESKQILRGNEYAKRSTRNIFMNLVPRALMETRHYPIIPFDDYQAKRSALEELIGKHCCLDKLTLNHIPDVCYRLFSSSVDRQACKVIVTFKNPEEGTEILRLIGGCTY